MKSLASFEVIVPGAKEREKARTGMLFGAAVCLLITIAFLSGVSFLGIPHEGIIGLTAVGAIPGIGLLIAAVIITHRLKEAAAAFALQTEGKWALNAWCIRGAERTAAGHFRFDLINYTTTMRNIEVTTNRIRKDHDEAVLGNPAGPVAAFSDVWCHVQDTGTVIVYFGGSFTFAGVGSLDELPGIGLWEPRQYPARPASFPDLSEPIKEDATT